MHLNRLPTLRVIGKWSICLMLSIPFVANAQVFQSSRTGDKEDVELPIPLGAVVYKADEKEVTRQVGRTISCTELYRDAYGEPNTSMYYEGGPVRQHRFELGLLINEAGNLIRDEHGNYQNEYTEWIKESGQCMRRHVDKSTEMCDPSQIGERKFERKYYFQDTLTGPINTSARLGDTGWILVADTCRNK